MSSKGGGQEHSAANVTLSPPPAIIGHVTGRHQTGQTGSKDGHQEQEMRSAPAGQGRPSGGCLPPEGATGLLCYFAPLHAMAVLEGKLPPEKAAVKLNSQSPGYPGM